MWGGGNDDFDVAREGGVPKRGKLDVIIERSHISLAWIVHRGKRFTLSTNQETRILDNV